MPDYILPELIPNILGRLPVSDVLRCTSVCKSWYDLITSSSFISLHLKLSTPNQQSRLHVIFHKDNGVLEEDHCRVHCDNQTFDEIAELECPLDGNFLKIIGTINGLLCLYNSNMFCKRVLLWNPSLGKSLRLPDSGLKISDAIRFGFGFLPETNDYKIVRLLLCDRYTDFIQLMIYELSTNSWRNVSVGEVSYLPLNDNPAVFIKGSLHWGVKIRHNHDGGKFGRLIVSFDMKNENVGALSVPNCLDNDASYFDVVTFEESLCLIHSSDTHYNIWVMKEYGIPDSWTMQFKIDSFKICKGYHGLTSLLYFRENGEIIFEKTPKKEWKLTTDNGFMFASLSRRLVSYDPTSNQVMDIGKWETNFGFCVTTYMESLVSIKS